MSDTQRAARIRLGLAIVILLVGGVAGSALSQEASPAAADTPVWTPQPVSLLQTGTPEKPSFNTVYGVIKDGKVYAVRFRESGTEVTILNPGGTAIR